MLIFDLPEGMKTICRDLLARFDGLVEGAQWQQGDHSIFLQQGCPAIAVSSHWLIERMEDQQITHTSEDNIGIVDPCKVVEIAEALNWFLRQ